MRYDAAIIGAGADGLAAAVLLARAGLSVLVAERASGSGGRCTTREFHPGFFASPFADEILPVPPELFWTLGLARRGVLFGPPAASALAREADAQARAARVHMLAAARARPCRWLPRWLPQQPLPAQQSDWPVRSLDEALGQAPKGQDENARAHALMGRAADPGLAGSALHLLSPGGGGSGLVRGGLGMLGQALAAAAREAGAEIRPGPEVSEIRFEKKRVRGLLLADGRFIEAAAVISTLDFKRTFLSFFKWSDLPPSLVARAGAFRMVGSTARLLVALARRLDGSGDAPLALAEESRGAALAAWRSGTIPERPPVSLRDLGASDPSLAPAGATVLTATIGCVPYALFDSGWTREKRELLRERVLTLIAATLPGVREAILASEIIVPPDIEAALGLGMGDLCGGEIAPDQMFGFRPGGGPADRDFAGGRTPLSGLYLAGPSSAGAPLGTCFAGSVAAAALLADRRAGFANMGFWR